MIKWKKVMSEGADEGKIIVYKGLDTCLTIETHYDVFPRKNGKGTIAYPSYTVYEDGEAVRTFPLLTIAKRWASDEYKKNDTFGHFYIRR